jgi:hypothetical protein
MKAQLVENDKKNSELKHTNLQLEHTIAGFVMQNQKLHSERDEYLRFLDEARNALSTYRKIDEEYPFLVLFYCFTIFFKKLI